MGFQSFSKKSRGDIDRIVMGGSQMIGIGLVAGSGTRARPLTLKTANYLRSKAAIRFLGRPIIEWQIDSMKADGIQDFIMVARGRENRFQVKTLIGYGEGHGVSVRYSPPILDHLDRGSADATIRSAEYFDLEGELFIFPVDSLIDLDMATLARVHRRRRPAMTIITTEVVGAKVANTYGVLILDERGRVQDFLEKPSPAILKDRFGPHWATLPLTTNAGFYLTRAEVLREQALHMEISHMRSHQLDFGHDLLPWLVRQNLLVQAFPARWVGDLGSLPQYLESMVDLLSGVATPPGFDLGPDQHPPLHHFGVARPPGSASPWTTVRLGRYVHVGPDCHFRNVSIGDECLIGRGVTLEDVHLDDGVIIGDGAVIRSSVVGLMATIHSSSDHPTYIEKISGIGDEAVIESGAHLENVLVYPRTTVKPNVHIIGPAVIQPGSTSLRARGRRVQVQARLLGRALKGGGSLHVPSRIHKVRSASV